LTDQNRIVDRTRAEHSIDLTLLAERCAVCGIPAAHIVSERLGTPLRPIASYLCCAHFGFLLGDCSRYPYDLPARRTG